jgi:hypothetical protein
MFDDQSLVCVQQSVLVKSREEERERCMATWLFVNFHWLIITGIFLSILGALYSSYGLFNIKIFSRLTQTFTFGMMGGAVGVAAIVLVSILDFISLNIRLITARASATLFQEGYKNTFTALITNSALFLTLGITIGLLIGLIQDQALKASTSTRPYSRKKNLILLLLGVALLFIILILDYFRVDTGIFIYLEILYGFIGGALFDKFHITFWKLVVAFVCFFFFILLLNKFFASFSLIAIIIGVIVAGLTAFCMGFLPGSLFNQSPNPVKASKTPSWERFVLWLTVGYMCGLVLPLFDRLVLNDTVHRLTFLAVTVSLMIVFGNGEGSVLIYLIKPKYKARQNVIWPVVNWQRFRRGFLIAWAYTFCGMFLLSTNLFFENPQTQVLGYPTVIFISAAIGVGIGMISAFLYGFGYIIVFRVNMWPERRIGQIGLALTVLGIIIASLPSLFV